MFSFRLNATNVLSYFPKIHKNIPQDDGNEKHMQCVPPPSSFDWPPDVADVATALPNFLFLVDAAINGYGTTGNDQRTEEAKEEAQYLYVKDTLWMMHDDHAISIYMEQTRAKPILGLVSISRRSSRCLIRS